MKPTVNPFWKQPIYFARRYWIGISAAALLLLVLLVGTPAWASPVASPAQQTVPQPTPTSSTDPIATATPLPGDETDEPSSGDNNEGAASGGEGEVIEQGDIDAIIFSPPASNGSAADAPPLYTAIISVATLNVREGPGTDFNIVGSVEGDQEVNVLFRNGDNSWWYICCVANSETHGWISAQLAEPTFDRDQALDLIPEFGTDEPTAETASAATAATEDASDSAADTTTAQPAAQLPLELSASHAPEFVWQGQRVDMVFTISNPHAVAVTEVELSDDLPAQLELLGAEATLQGEVTQEATVNDTVLVRVRWESIPAGGSVSATISARILPDVQDGAVIDNLAAVRGRNSAYSSVGISIGMPPVTIPMFQ